MSNRKTTSGYRAKKVVTSPNNKIKKVTHNNVLDKVNTSHDSSEIEVSSISTNEVNVIADDRMKSLAKRWVSFLSGIFTPILATIICILLGFNPVPASIPLLNLTHQYPILILGIGGALTVSFTTALILSSKQEHPNSSNKSRHISPSLFSAAIATISIFICIALLSTVFFRLPWCPTTLCPSPQIVTNPNGVHDANLEVYLITTQSTSVVIPGDPVYYSESKLPESVSAMRIDKKTDFPYRAVLGVHSLQQGRYGILLVQVGLLVNQVKLIPRPLNIWTKGIPLTYNTNSYQAIYKGQKVGDIFPATYVPAPFANVQLYPGEADQLNVQVSSHIPADIQFRVQIVYRIVNEPQLYSLTLTSTLEVVFSDASNWHEFRLQNGHFMANA